MLPTISIIIPVYNGEETILQALNCALSQSYPSFDVVVVNDGSTDRTLEILNSVKHPKLKIVNLNPNAGRSNARNTGAKFSVAEYIAFLDADDTIPPEKLQKQMDYMLTNNLEMCGTWGMAGNLIYKHPVSDQVIKSRIIKSHTFIHSSVICKRDIFLKHGGYDSSLNFSEDYDLFLKIVKDCTVGNLSEALVTYQLPSGIRYGLKEQYSIAKIRFRAITKYNYSWLNFPFIFSPIVAFFVPRKFKLLLKQLIN